MCQVPLWRYRGQNINMFVGKAKYIAKLRVVNYLP